MQRSSSSHVPIGTAAGNAQDVLRHVQNFVKLESTRIGELFRQAVSEWLDDNASRLGASLAYYTLLSIAPLLIVTVAVAAIIFGKAAAEGQLFWETKDLLGSDAASAIQGLVRGASHPATGIFSAVVAFAATLFGASSLVLELTGALNTIWRVPADPTPFRLGKVMNMLRQRLKAFAIVLGTGFLLLVSLLLNAAITILGSFFASALPVSAGLLRLGEFILAFCVTTMLFAAIYKFVPSITLQWSDVFVGAFVTSLLFTAGKQVLGIYLGHASFSSTYGAAGSIIAVLVWVYYSAQLFFLGAEFTKVYTKALGSQRGPAAA